jgi:uncharacterized coiled-coil protein SlyX
MKIICTHCRVTVIQSQGRSPTACCGAIVSTAERRIRELEELLCEAEQELEAATAIIAEQDRQLDLLKFQLEEAELVAELSDMRCRKLEQDAKQFAVAHATTTQPPPAPTDVRQGPMPATVPSAEGKNPSYLPGYKPNPLVEAMVAGFRAGRK